MFLVTDEQFEKFKECVNKLKELEEALACFIKLNDLHSSYISSGEPTCLNCGSSYPCETVKIIGKFINDIKR